MDSERPRLLYLEERIQIARERLNGRTSALAKEMELNGFQEEVLQAFVLDLMDLLAGDPFGEQR